MRPVKLNQMLVEKQGLSQEEVWKIQDLHNVRRSIEFTMQKTQKPEELRRLFDDWTKCQFELQKAWKFTEDARYHKSWLVPNCGCPVLDNEDRYPHGPYVISLSCLVHSKETLT